MPKLIAGILLGLATLPALASPASAQQRMQLEPGTDWVHSHSGIMVPETLGGIVRSVATAYVRDDLDSSVHYVSPDRQQALSVYVFRNTNGAAPLWFAQAQAPIETRDAYAGPTLISGPESRTLPGRDAPSGLRAIYQTGKDSVYRSTGVSLHHVGDWYLKIRASSATRSAERLQVWMDEVVNELAVPATLESPSSIAPITDCTSRLEFRGKSRNADKDLGADLLAALVVVPLPDDLQEPEGEAEVKPNPVWCRDPGNHDGAAIFRPDASATSYLLALGDSGRGVWVAPDTKATVLSDDAGTKGRYSIAAFMPGVTINFVAQDRMPKPSRVLQIFDSNQRVSTVSTWGEDSAISIVP